jgi:hypothetical protein
MDVTQEYLLDTPTNMYTRKRRSGIQCGSQKEYLSQRSERIVQCSDKRNDKLYMPIPYKHLTYQHPAATLKTLSLVSFPLVRGLLPVLPPLVCTQALSVLSNVVYELCSANVTLARRRFHSIYRFSAKLEQEDHCRTYFAHSTQ